MGWCETRASWKISNIKSWEVLRILFYALARLCCHDQSGKFFGDSCGFFWGDEISGCIRLIFLFELVQWHGSVVIWVDGVESWNSMIYAHMKARVVGFQIPEFRESRICSSTPVLPRFLWSFTGSTCSKKIVVVIIIINIIINNSFETFHHYLLMIRGTPSSTP